MREIKFRAWNGQYMHYSNSASLQPYLSEDFILKGYETIGNADLLWMQFTGLHDAKGRDIYEGDIVRMDSSVGKKPGLVRFTEAAFLVYVNKGHQNTDYHSPLSERDEVIGNIYQTPELLIV